MVNISRFLGCKMEEKLFACVAAYPVLYDTSLYLYKTLIKSMRPGTVLPTLSMLPVVFLYFQI